MKLSVVFGVANPIIFKRCELLPKLLSLLEAGPNQSEQFRLCHESVIRTLLDVLNKLGAPAVDRSDMHSNHGKVEQFLKTRLELPCTFMADHRF